MALCRSKNRDGILVNLSKYEEFFASDKGASGIMAGVNNILLAEYVRLLLGGRRRARCECFEERVSLSLTPAKNRHGPRQFCQQNVYSSCKSLINYH